MTWSETNQPCINRQYNQIILGIQIKHPHQVHLSPLGEELSKVIILPPQLNMNLSRETALSNMLAAKRETNSLIN